MNLKKLNEVDLKDKRVLLRLDLDVKGDSDLRLTSSKETIDYLISQKSKIIIIGHKGRPSGKVSKELSLEETAKDLSKVVSKEIKFVFDVCGSEAQEEVAKLESGQILMLENLRFDNREEENDDQFSKTLAAMADVFVNEAFGVSHRNHASIVGIPKHIPSAFGFRFSKEIENLSKLFEEEVKPVVVVISGVKEDKVEMAKKLSQNYAKVLVGGRLPEYFGDEGLVSVRNRGEDEKLIIGNLVQDKEDITLNTIERFKLELSKAKAVVLAGVLGRYEDGGHIQGTKEIFEYISKLKAFKVAGGGDTENCLSSLNLTDKFDWISVGGGAALEYLINKTLPALSV